MDEKLNRQYQRAVLMKRIVWVLTVLFYIGAWILPENKILFAYFVPISVMILGFIHGVLMVRISCCAQGEQKTYDKKQVKNVLYWSIVLGGLGLLVVFWVVSML